MRVIGVFGSDPAVADAKIPGVTAADDLLEPPRGGPPPPGGTPPRTTVRRRGPWVDRAPALALGVMLVVWSVVLFRLAELRHDRFGTFGFDLGIYDQAGWLVAFGRDPFMTVRGLDVWGHHGTFVFYLLAPGYWFGGGPKWLLFAQVTSQAVGGLALYLLVRDTLGRRWRWFGVGAAAVLLLHPTSQFMVWEFFHPEAFAIGPLLLAWWAARTQRWAIFGASAFVAATCKEDIVLAVAMMGIVVASSRPRSARTIRIGAGTTFVMLGWYVLVTKWLIPARNPGGVFYEDRFGDFGDDPIQVAFHVARHPMSTWDFVTQAGHLEYYRMMFLPVLLLCFLRPKVLLVGAPLFAVNVLVSDGFPFPRDYRYHYSAIVAAVVALAAVEVVIRAAELVAHRTDWRRWIPHGVMTALLVAGLVATHQSGVFPGSERARPGGGFWPRWPDESVLDVVLGVDVDRDVHAAAKADAVDRLPAGASVSAAYNIVPHVAHRERIYEFPNPWIPQNWGVDDERQHDPADVDWLVLDRRLLGQGNQRDVAIGAVLDQLLAGEFEIVFERDDVVLARRVRAPGCLDDPDGALAAALNPDAYDTSAPPSTGSVCPVT